MASTLLVCLAKISVFVLLGFFLRKKGKFSDQTQSDLTGILLNIIAPCVILVSSKQQFDRSSGNSVFLCIGAGLVYYLFWLLVCFIIFRIIPVAENKRGVSVTSCVFGNTGFIGYPLVIALLGQDSMLFASSFEIWFNLFIFTIGVQLISGKKGDFSFRKLITPCTVSVVISLIIYFSPYRLPDVVYDTMSMLSSMMVPVSMIIIGSGLAGMAFKSLFSDWHAYVVVVIRQIIIPVSTVQILKLIPAFSDQVISVIAVISAVPTGSYNVILSRRYSAMEQVDYANSILLLSLLTSFVTLPLIIGVLL